MKSFCAYFNKGVCRSCDLITLTYPEQILDKERRLKDSLSGLTIPSLLRTVESNPQHFRNKAKLVVTGPSEAPVLGLTGEDQLDEGRELLNCELHTPEINALLPKIKSFITLAKLIPYSIEKKTGELKGIIVFYSKSSSEYYLRFIMRSKEAVTRIKKHSSYLSEVASISVNIQPIPHALLEGEEEVFITDRTYINHQYGKVSGQLGPRAFVQTNQNISEELYSTAALWTKELNTKRFLELYCGQGAFSFHCAPFVKEGLGIEINEDAVKVANRTAGESKLAHLEFKSADAAKVGPEIDQFRPDTLLVNPPRRGLAEAVNLLRERDIKHIIYSSCNYETLAKDLKLLDEKYAIKKIQIFDMFPHTSHFETLVLLEHRSI